MGFSFFKNPLTAFNTVFSTTYKDPKKYHDYVHMNGRAQLAKQVADQLANEIPSHSGLILDLAAGTGIVSGALRAKGFTVVATDHDIKMLAEIGACDGITTKRLDFNNTFPFEDNYFDGATIVWGNRYISNIHSFITQIHRVLKPGGVFVWPYFNIEIPLWMLLSKPGLLPSVTNVSRLVQNVGFTLDIVKQPKFFTVTSPGYMICTKPF